MTHYDIPMDAAKDSRTTYGVIYSSRFVYEVGRKWSGPTRLDAWDNTDRPNPFKDARIGQEIRGQVVNEYFVNRPNIPGHPERANPLTAKWFDPRNEPTDDPITFLLSPESSCITNNGTNTGTVASGQVYAKDVPPMRDGDTATLSYPDGSTAEVVLSFPRHQNGHGFAFLTKGRVNA